MVGFQPAPQRGQNEALGAVLVFAVIVAAISVTLIGGGQGLTSSSQAVHAEQTQNSLVDLAANVDEITHGSSDNQRAQLKLDTRGDQGHVQVEDEAGSLKVEVGGSTMYNDTLGAVVYTHEDLSIAYQGGGVWRQKANGTIMVSAPGLSDRESSQSSPSTLTFPIIQVTGMDSLTTEATFSKEETNVLYPSKQVASSETVTIRIESKFAEGWATLFVERLGVDENGVTVSNDGTVVEVQYADSEEAYLHVTHYKVHITDG